jgi:hypothetical protein
VLGIGDKASRINNIRAKSRAGVLVVCLWGALLGAAGNSMAASPEQTEHEIKAAMLYNFAMFVEWPDSAMPAPGEPLIVGILGKDPFGEVLDEMMAGERIHGHPIEVRRYPRVSDLEICQLLFISDSAGKRLGEIIQVVDASGVLTVGESQGFSKQGGMIGFVREGRKIRFEINIDAAQRAGFKISSKLLRLAKVTRGSAK